jgi:uncharacterized membrane protein
MCMVKYQGNALLHIHLYVTNDYVLFVSIYACSVGKSNKSYAKISMKNQCCSRGVSYMLCMGWKLPNFVYTKVRKIIAELRSIDIVVIVLLVVFIYMYIRIHYSIEWSVESKVNVICTMIFLYVLLVYVYQNQKRWFLFSSSWCDW